jgi:hypothetical protein
LRIPRDNEVRAKLGEGGKQKLREVGVIGDDEASVIIVRKVRFEGNADKSQSLDCERADVGAKAAAKDTARNALDIFGEAHGALVVFACVAMQQDISLENRAVGDGVKGIIGIYFSCLPDCAT